MQRIIAGQHPSGPIGLFVSAAGVDASTADPNAVDPWIFSSQWGGVGGILMSGQVNQETDVSLPAGVDFNPVIWWSRFTTASGVITLLPTESFQQIDASVNNSCAPFKITYGGSGSNRTFRVAKMNSQVAMSGAQFLYAALNFNCAVP